MKQTHIHAIDGLRAFAVGAVILYHYFPGALPGGFLGVDVFFVISGFVITRLFWFSHAPGRVGFLLDFYARRLRRLLPALVVCIAVTCLLLVLLAPRFDGATLVTAGTATFGASNLWLNFLAHDYFAIDAQLNAFTHTWSLGVEEQFYLLYPLLAVVLGIVGGAAARLQGWALTLLAALGLVSLAAYLVTAPGDPVSAFYLPGHRLWELLAGALAWLLGTRAGAPHRSVATLGAAGLGVLVLAPVETVVLAPVLAVACTAAVLFRIAERGEALLDRALAAGVPAFLGRISYSLYLYHWPLFVLAGLTIGHSAAALAATLAASLLLSVVSFRYVENPLRRSRPELSRIKVIGVSFAVMLLVSFSTIVLLPMQTKGRGGVLFTQLSILAAPEETAWPDYDCHGHERLARLADPLAHCLGKAPNGAGRDLFLLGDSHAAQLIPLVEALEGGTLRSVNFINTEGVEDFPYAFWASPQVGHDQVLEHLLKVADPGDIVLIAFHRGRLNGVRDRHIPLTRPVVINDKGRNFVASLRPWLRRLQEAGLDVIFFADTPLLPRVVAIESCLLQTRLFGRNECAVTRAQDRHTRARQEQSFQTLAEEFAGVFYYDPAPLLFDGGQVFDPVSPDGSVKMIDWHHLTVETARSLAGDFREFLNTRDDSRLRAETLHPAR